MTYRYIKVYSNIRSFFDIYCWIIIIIKIIFDYNDYLCIIQIYNRTYEQRY